MINSISSAPPPPPSQSAQTSLTDEQKALISETLENIDPDNLTQEQAIEIVEAFSAAGIDPGKELAETLAEAGFDAREIGDLARESNVSADTGSSSEQVDLVDLVEYLELLLEQFGGESLSETDKTDVYEDLRERFGLAEDESIISVTA